MRRYNPWIEIHPFAYPHTCPKQPSRAGLVGSDPIWEWINRDLLPTMARDDVDEIDKLSIGDKQKELRKAAAGHRAMTVSMVLDQVEDARSTLRMALRKNRVQVARDILIAIYNTEHALQVRINGLDESRWGSGFAT